MIPPNVQVPTCYRRARYSRFVQWHRWLTLCTRGPYVTQGHSPLAGTVHYVHMPEKFLRTSSEQRKAETKFPRTRSLGGASTRICTHVCADTCVSAEKINKSTPARALRAHEPVYLRDQHNGHLHLVIICGRSTYVSLYLSSESRYVCARLCTRSAARARNQHTRKGHLMYRGKFL